MSNRENFMHLTVDAKTAGIDRSSARGSTVETSLWEAENLYLNAGNTIGKRPQYIQWGSPILEVDSPQNSAGESLEIDALYNKDYLEKTVQSGPNSSIGWSNNSLQMSGWVRGVTPSTTIMQRAVQPGESFSTINDFCLTMHIRGNNLPAADDYIFIRFAVKENELRTLMMRDTGIYYETADGVWTQVTATSDIFDGAPHCIKIGQKEDDSYFQVDNALSSTGFNDWSYVRNTNDYFFEFECSAGFGMLGSGNYAISLSGVSLRDKEDAVVSPKISDIRTLKVTKSNGLDSHRLVAAGEKFIWVDYDNTGLWQQLYRKKYENTFITEFRGGLVFINYSSSDNSEVVWYKADGSFTILSEAPKCRFGTEFAGRLWLAGNPKDSRRLYYSADRDPTSWIVPAYGTTPTLEELLDAGYIDIPGSAREKVTYMTGKYYRMLVVGTEQSLWGISGSSPLDFSRSVIAGDIGAAGPKAGIGALNDLMVLGPNGVVSLMSTDKFGDIAIERKSYLIKGLFDYHNIAEGGVSPANLSKAHATFSQIHGELFLHLPTAGQNTPDKTYCARFPTLQWFGPWDEDATCSSPVILSVPTAEHTAIGTSDGYVKYLAYMRPDTSTSKLSTPWLDGRSLDPTLQFREKSWKKLRMAINPTGNWTATVRWICAQAPWQEKTINLFSKSSVFLGGATCKTGTVLTSDKSERLIKEIMLDVRGTALKVEVTSNAPRVSYIGMDIDFAVSGYEQE